MPTPRIVGGTAVALVVAAVAATADVAPRTDASHPPFPLVEATITQMQAAMAAGQLTSRDLVSAYLARIGLYEHSLNAAISINPHALEEAEALDRERAEHRIRGPLHGIPIALKDNIQTIEMPTTGGALAFAGMVPRYEATLTGHLRAAGAIILAKTMMTELVGAIGDTPGNYNAIAGFGFNPYDARRDQREATFGRPVLTPGGSSSGSGTAANLWAANVGTETSGSILGPAFLTMLVGVKPTVGRISRYGIIPHNLDQDTAGPMARNVTDAAILLGALEGTATDAHDPATTRCARPAAGDYTRFLRPDALSGARLGIPRAYFYDQARAPGDQELRGGLSQDRAAVMREAIEILKRLGATIVDPVEIPSVNAEAPVDSFLTWTACARRERRKNDPGGCSIAFQYALKRDLNSWLTSLGPAAPVRNLTELREWNVKHAAAGAIRFGQSGLDVADEIDLEKDRSRYVADRTKDVERATTQGIDAVVARYRLDALLFPASSGAALSALAGYPTVVVPFGRAAAPRDPAYPAAFQPVPWPYGVSFAAAACSEPKLLALAYAFEQATHRRVPPPSFE